MADIHISAFTVVAKKKWTPELKQEIGEKILRRLYSKWQENYDVPIPEDLDEFLTSKNHSALTTITVSTS